VDVERTIQFILRSQAKAEIRMQKAEERIERADRRVEARLDSMEKRFDRRLNAIAKLLQQGMGMLAKTDTRLPELAEAQKETDRTLKAFIRSMRNGRNGR
jgi:hypothetical protein